MKKRPLILITLLSAGILAQTGLYARSVILPVEAIDDTAEMSAAEFEATYEGIDVSGYVPDEEGYYIVYSHTNLTYYFGPLEDPQEAMRWEEKLQKIVNKATALRPTLQKGFVDIYTFDAETLEKVVIVGEVDSVPEQARAVQKQGVESAADTGDSDEPVEVVVITGEDAQTATQRAVANQKAGKGSGKGTTGGGSASGGGTTGSGGSGSSGTGTGGGSGSGSGGDGSGDGEGGGFFSNIWRSIFGG